MKERRQALLDDRSVAGRAWCDAYTQLVDEWLAGESTLSVFGRALGKVEELRSEVSAAPAGLRAVRHRVKRAPWAA